MSWKTPRDGNGDAATTRRRRGGMRCRTLTAAVDNGGDDDSRSTAHSAMARARRRCDGTPREDPAKGTDATAMDVTRALPPPGAANNTSDR